MGTMTTITVTARHWAGGWELILDENNATSVRTLARAEDQVRDYLDTLDPDVDHHGVCIQIVPDIGALSQQISQAREKTSAASRAQVEAASESRDVARTLREQGFSLADTAALLGVSKGRVSQLLSDVSA